MFGNDGGGGVATLEKIQLLEVAELLIDAGMRAHLVSIFCGLDRMIVRRFAEDVSGGDIQGGRVPVSSLRYLKAKQDAQGLSAFAVFYQSIYGGKITPYSLFRAFDDFSRLYLGRIDINGAYFVIAELISGSLQFCECSCDSTYLYEPSLPFTKACPFCRENPRQERIFSLRGSEPSSAESMEKYCIGASLSSPEKFRKMRLARDLLAEGMIVPYVHNLLNLSPYVVRSLWSELNPGKRPRKGQTMVDASGMLRSKKTIAKFTAFARTYQAMYGDRLPVADAILHATRQFSTVVGKIDINQAYRMMVGVCTGEVAFKECNIPGCDMAFLYSPSALIQSCCFCGKISP